MTSNDKSRVCHTCRRSYTIDEYLESSASYFDGPINYDDGCTTYCLACWLGVGDDDFPAQVTLQHLEIENFKAIGQRQRIELAPITLLFGPNSAGKSTIVQALHYARELIERGNADADRTLYGAEIVDLGGFATLVHKHELTREVVLRLELDTRGEVLVELDEAELDHEMTHTLAELNLAASVAVELGVRWTPQGARVARYEVHWNGEALLGIEAEADGKDVAVRWMNLQHPLFSAPDIGADHEDEDEDEDNGASQRDRFDVELHPLRALVDRELLETFDNAVASDAATEPVKLSGRALNAIRGLGRSSRPARMPVRHIELAGMLGAVPGPAFELAIDEGYLSDWDGPSTPEDDELVHPIWRELLEQMIIVPVRLATRALERFRYLGPIRTAVPRDFAPTRYHDEARWADGTAAWDALAHHGADFTRRVSDWMSREDRLATGYEVEVHRFRALDVQGPEWLALESGRVFDDFDFDEFRKRLEALPVHEQLILREVGTRFEVNPRDVGVGITQVLPVVVAALEPSGDLVAIEQPELHVHPAVQVRLGDLFIRASGERRCTFLIETHSEHLMLRLLRRIRETHEGELPTPELTLTPAHVAVLYVEPGEDGVKVSRLRVSEDGDFDDQWPRGFFTERADELF